MLYSGIHYSIFSIVAKCRLDTLSLYSLNLTLCESLVKFAWHSFNSLYPLYLRCISYLHTHIKSSICVAINYIHCICGSV